MKEFQDLVSIVPWTFIAQICNLFIQVYLIKRFLFKPIRNMLKKRQEKADAEIQAAKQAKEEALAIKSEYEQNMQEAREKANDILVTAQKNASVRTDEMIKEATEAAAAIKSKAQKDIDQEKKKAVNEIKNEIGSMAMEIAGKVVEREVNEADYAKMIDDFITNVGDAS